MMIHAAEIRGPMAFYIANFLEDRKFRTRIGQQTSDLHIQEEGVPQGSLLSCTLFSLAINGIVGDLPQYICASLYVDDLVIYTASSHVPSLVRQL